MRLRSSMRDLATGPDLNLLRLQFGLVHISAGDLLRAEVAAATDAGKKAEAFMSQGFLVPNELVCVGMIYMASFGSLLSMPQSS